MNAPINKIQIGWDIISNERMLAVLRLMIILGTWVRLALGYERADSVHTVLWLSVLGSYTLYAFWSAFSVYRRPSKINYLVVVLVDTVFISAIYLLSTHPNSDFFLFYFLPLLTAIEFLSTLITTSLLLLISVIYLVAFVILKLAYRDSETALGLNEALVHNFLPKWFFFAIIALFALARQRVQVNQNQASIAVQRRLKAQNEEIEAIHETTIKIAKNEALQSRLDAIISGAIELLHAKGCIVYLRKQDQDILELVALGGSIKSKSLKPGYLLPFGKGMAGRLMIEDRAYLIVNDYAKSKYAIPEFRTLFEAVVEVPLVFGNHKIGVLAVVDVKEQRTFSKDDVPVLQRLAQYAALAIHEMQVVQQLERRTRAIGLINDAARVMNTTLLQERIVQTVVSTAWKLADLYTEGVPLLAYLALVSKSGQYLEFVAAYPQSELEALRADVKRIDLVGKEPVGIIGKVVLSGKAQRVTNVDREPEYIKFHQRTQAQLAVPFFDKQKRIAGVLSVEHAGKVLPLELQENLDNLGLQASAALENAKLIKDITHQVDQAETLLRVTADYGLGEMTLDDVGQQILDGLYRIVTYDRATLQIIDNSTGARRLLAKVGLSDEQVDKSLLRPISEDRMIQNILSAKGISRESPPSNNPLWEKRASTEDIEAWIGIPLVYGNEPIGLITVDQLQTNAHSPEQMGLLELFSQHVTSLLQNALSFEKYAERVAELTQAREYLQTMIEFFQSYYTLALIGVVYGEDIHYARMLLSTAASSARAIADNLVAPQDISIRASRISDNINRYLAVIEETKKVALENVEHQQIDLHALLEEVVNSKNISSGITVSYEFQADPAFVFAPRQLRQVFFVLIQNAIDAVGAQGEVVLSTERIVSPENSTFISVLVSDSGSGIPNDLRNRLFTPRVGRQVAARRTGTGLGLPWAYAFMHVYKGNVSCIRTSDKGTTMEVLVPEDFRAVLPLSLDPAEVRALITHLGNVTVV